MPNKRKKRSILLAAMIIVCLGLLTGCGQFDFSDTKVVLTTGFKKDEVFRIETISCSVPEIMVYLTNTQNQYEQVYGDRIWITNVDGITLEENIKETVLAKMAQVKTMNLMAEQYGVGLEESEEKLVKLAAEQYFNSLNQQEITGMGVSLEVIEKLYREYALAEKVYQYTIKDVNPEISDDEARIITVEHILIKTYTLDGKEQKVEYTQRDREEAYERAKEALQKARSGEYTFEALIQEYSEDENVSYSFGKGERPITFEEAAFNLGTNEISDIVETEYGYHIIKCISTFNKEETDANKVKIVEKKRRELFGEEYDAFVASLIRDLNEPLWESITLLHDEENTTSDFFSVYDQVFLEF